MSTRLPIFVLIAATLACSGGGGGGGDGGGSQDDAAALRGHVLSRTGYGPDDWSRARIETLGVDAYIEEQLDPGSLTDPEVDAILAAYPTLGLDFFELVDLYAMDPFTPLVELSRAKIVRSIRSRRQLEQALTDFWFDHFNVFGADGFTNFAVGPYERDAIRAHVLGRFEDMLRAVARHAAMLYYLDNFRSTKEGFVFQGELRGLNENWARELMELHTLGVDGGYDQDDVVAVARAFTGWTIGPEAFADVDGFFFWPQAHDDDPKSVMDTLFIPANGGIQDGLDVIHFLATHASTADFLCEKLVRRFVNEDAPGALVADCAAAFLASDGDLAEVTALILQSNEFESQANRKAKVKRPIAYIASLARATGSELPDVALNAFFGLLSLLGEPPFQARPPTGFPEASSHWATGGTLVSRFNTATQLVAADAVLGIDWGVTGGTSAEIVDALVEDLFPAGVDARTRTLSVEHLDGLGAIPDPQRVREAASILLSSPDFLRH